MILADIKPTADPRELLAIDAERPLVDLASHPVWQSALSGEMDKERLKKLILLIYPVVAGPGRYLFAAKVSQISAEDGAELFRQLYEAEQNPQANSDSGWRAVGAALGIEDDRFTAVADTPSAEAADFLATVRRHSLRSAPSSAAAVAWAIERQLPGLWQDLADSLAKNYQVSEEALIHLRYQASRRDDVDRWVEQLLRRYYDGAESYAVFEARRALWEAVWAWTALTESLDT